MEEGSERDVILKTIEASEPADFSSVVSRANVESGSAQSILKEMASDNLVVALGRRSAGQGSIVYTAEGWSSVSDRVHGALQEYHDQFPLRRGAPKEELRSRLGMSSQVFGAALPRLQQDEVAVEEGTVVMASPSPARTVRRTEGHRRRLSEAAGLEPLLSSHRVPRGPGHAGASRR